MRQAAVRQLSESSAEVVQAKSVAEEDARSLREQLIKREKKLSAVLQVRGSGGGGALPMAS